MTYLLDTDIVIDYFNHYEPETKLVEHLLSTARVTISALTVTEVRTGWTEEKSSYYMPRLYKLFPIEVVTQEIAEQAGVWRYEYRTKGKQLGVPDSVVAATTYLKGHCLVTNNRKDYPMPELQLYQNIYE